MPHLTAEVQSDRRLERELGDADEPELDLGADARADVEAEAGAMNVRRRGGARRDVLRGFGLRRVAEVQLRDEEELVVLAIGEREREAP